LENAQVQTKQTRVQFHVALRLFSALSSSSELSLYLSKDGRNGLAKVGQDDKGNMTRREACEVLDLQSVAQTPRALCSAASHRCALRGGA
jgi:hypothetical protein